jgi:hypothetical protein
MAKSKRRKKVDVVALDNAVIDRAIRKVLKGLQWEVTIDEVGTKCDIESDEIKKCHHIRLPKHDPYKGLSTLHELCHANLAEKVHPLFGVNRFASDSKKDLVVASGWALQMAADWFVDELEHSHASGPYKKELDDDFAKACEVVKHTDIDLGIVCSSALVLVQSRRYLPYSIEPEGFLAELVHAFEATDPSLPTIENLTVLANRTLHILHEGIGQLIQVECVMDDEKHAWKFI